MAQRLKADSWSEELMFTCSTYSTIVIWLKARDEHTCTTTQVIFFSFLSNFVRQKWCSRTYPFSNLQSWNYKLTFFMITSAVCPSLAIFFIVVLENKAPPISGVWLHRLFVHEVWGEWLSKPASSTDLPSKLGLRRPTMTCPRATYTKPFAPPNPPPLPSGTPSGAGGNSVSYSIFDWP